MPQMLGPRQNKGTTREDLKTAVEDKTTAGLLRKIAGSLNGRSPDPKPAPDNAKKLADELGKQIRAATNPAPDRVTHDLLRQVVKGLKSKPEPKPVAPVKNSGSDVKLVIQISRD